MSYTPPSVADLGSLADLTLINKVGRGGDVYTAIIPGLVGDVVPTPS
ncbi:MAG: lasso RiPP family leader peptide-containing protein [Gordonia polyisoprenivorans]|nr:lasso RiPP family leader peptide-containing protein [Gordonia polyisoprenivorans]